MNPIIKESIDRSISYQEYRTLVKQLAENNSNTGLEKTEALANNSAGAACFNAPSN